ncbi:MAG: Dyp-type peroxidase [Leptothrix sp. (in: b-proteobacteria)]
MTLPAQTGLLAGVPAQARYMRFQLRADATATAAVLQALAAQVDGVQTLVGLGASLVAALGAEIAHLHELTPPAGARVALPTNPAALWLWLRADSVDRGVLLQRSRQLEQLLAPAFELDGVQDAFRHAEGRDLTGYEDGTENPQDEAAVAAALLQGAGAGLDGSSFVAVQTWLHDLQRFDALSDAAQDHAIGRRRSDNEELDDAPPTAHVQRTAQESFTPEAFVLRRSMPWVDGQRGGLVFVAFGASLAAFEAQLARMAGCEDGLIDRLFSFTRPIESAAYWCPPMRNGQLDLRGVGL